MKKLFAVLAIASVIAACNNNTETKDTVVDSSTNESPLTDAIKTQDSANKIISDSTHGTPDSTKK